MDQAFFDAVKIDAADVIVRGLENTEHFSKYGVRKPVFLTRSRGREVVASAKEYGREKSDIKAILLECSMLPPYGKAVQDATGLPVFDFITMIDYVFSAVVKKKYEGFM